MDFSFTRDQLATRERHAEFARRELSDGVLRDDREMRFPREKWAKCAEFGLFRLGVPQEHAGDGADLMTAMLAMEGLGDGCPDNGFAFAVNGQLCIRMPIVTMGTDAQKARFLPAMCAGQCTVSFAFTEPDHGSDLFSIQTRAIKTDGGYVLTGCKTLVTYAPIAEMVLLLATINPDLGQWGLTAFLIDTNTPGCSVGPAQQKMGLRTSPLGDVVFDECFVTSDALLGPEGGGMAVLNSCLEWERCCVLASQLGAMQRQVETCIQYARDRRQFGRPIGEFFPIASRIADMQTRLQTSRLLLYKAGWLKQQGRPAMLESAMAKLHVSESFVQSSLDAIRLHGGVGYLTETGIERDLRDSLAGVIYGGTSDIQRNTIAGLMGLSGS